MSAPPAIVAAPARPPWTFLGLLGRLADFWGDSAFVRNGHERGVVHACCPSCKSKSLSAPHERYPLDVWIGPRGTWGLAVRCRCHPEHVYAALGWRPGERS